MAPISRLRALTDRISAHWESTWQWDRYASERTKLVKDTHAVMLECLKDSTPPLSSTMEAERNYFEKFSRVITPKKKSLDMDREIGIFEKAVNKRVKDADGILERFFQKSREEAELHFFLFPDQRPAEEGEEVRRLEKIAEDLRSESLALLVDGLGGSDANKMARYKANRKEVVSNLNKINSLIAKLKRSEERLRADADFDKGEFTNFDTPLAIAYDKANTYRNRTVRFFSKLYANPKSEIIRQAAAHPILAASALIVIGLGASVAAPAIYTAITPLATWMAPQKVLGAVSFTAGSLWLGFLNQKK